MEGRSTNSKANSSDILAIGQARGPADVLQSPRHHRYIIAAAVLLALAGVLGVVLDWREVRDVLVKAGWEMMPMALACAAASYLCLGLSYALVNRLFAIPLGWRDLLEIGFVSSAMIAAVGGLAGHSLRLLMMLRRGLDPGDVMAPSLFHGYFESLVFFAIIPVGLTYLVLTQPLPDNVGVAIAAGTGVLGIAFALTAVVFFLGPVRGLALALVRRAWRAVTRRDIQSALDDFQATLRIGLVEIRRRPRALMLPLLLIGADRLARVGVVWFCFQALGSDLGLGVLVTGFAVGVALGVMSMVPGGLGVQEGSMAGTYHLLGVPLEEAVLVSVLFRLVYYMVPFLVSLAFYRRIMRERAVA